ncbi:hypothetical protein CCP1ISM_70016 [Azospirillaceae bacterium]
MLLDHCKIMIIVIGTNFYGMTRVRVTHDSKSYGLTQKNCYHPSQLNKHMGVEQDEPGIWSSSAVGNSQGR